MPIIEEKTVVVHWNPKNKKHFEDKGYVFTKMFAPFEVSIFDTQGQNYTKLKCVCDECGEEFVSGYYSVKEDCRCQKCKTTESYMKRYGVPHNMKSQKGKDEYSKAIEKKYGVKNVFQNDKVKEKIKNTLIEKYGVEHPLQNKSILEKEKRTNLKRYGVEFVMQNKDKFEMSKSTCQKNYGVSSPMKNKTVRDKANATLAKQEASKNQIILNEWLHGELNYPLLSYRLDVGLEEDKIDVEYDGGGHYMEISIKGMSEEDFEKKETKRNNAILAKQWKVVRFVSLKNKLPEKQMAIDFIDKIKNIQRPLLVKWNIEEDIVNVGEKQYNTSEFLKMQEVVS